MAFTAVENPAGLKINLQCYIWCRKLFSFKILILSFTGINYHYMYASLVILKLHQRICHKIIQKYEKKLTQQLIPISVIRN